MEIERIRAKTNTPTSPNGQLYGDQVLHHQHLQTPRIDFPSNTSSYPPSGRLGQMKTEQQNHEIHLTAQEGGSRQTARLQNIIPNRMSAFSLHSQNVAWAGFAFPSAELKTEQTKPVPMEAEDYMHCDKEAQPARQGQPSAHFSDPNSSQGVKLEAQAAALGLNPLQSQCIDKFANRLREGYDTEKHQCPGDEDIGIIGRANYNGDKKSADSERASRMSNLSLAKFAKLAELAKGMPPYQRTQEFPGDFLSQRDGHAGYIYGEEAPTRCDPVGFGANCQRPVTSSCHHDSRHRIDLETGEGFTVGGAATGEGERVEGDETRSEVSVGVNYLSPPRSLLGRYEVTFGLRLRTGSDASDSAPRYRQPEAPTDSGQSSSEEFIANSDKMVEEVEARFGRSGTYLDSTSDRRGSSPINNYEQEAISSLIRLAKRVDSASDSGTAEGIARLEMNAPTSVGIQETGSSALYMTRPSSEPSERRLLERIKSEATDGSESQTCGGRSRGLSDSSPEEGNKFLQNYRDLVASAVAVVGHDADPTPGSDHPTDKEEICEGDERRREEVSESRETGERDPSAQMSSDYGAARTVFSGSFSPGVYPSAAATDFSVKFTATNPQPSQIALPQNGGYSSAASTPCYSFTSQMPLKVFTEQVVQAASNLHDCRRRVTTNFLLEPELSASVVWAYMMAQFEAHAHQVIRFARAIPGFRDLPRSDTKVLVQESMYPIVLIQMSRDFNATSMEYNFFNFTPRERRYILTEFPIMRKVAAQLRDAGTFLRPKNMDENEIALLCCIVFLQHFNRNLIESDRIYEMRAHAVSALRTYITVQYSTEERFYSLMEVLPILTNMNSSHRGIVKELMQTRQDLHFPDLYIQMFRLDDSTELEANNRSEGPAVLAPGTTLSSGEAEMIGSGN
nr:unnamed protein product [Spirometra erinaceieuropaei]